MIQQICQWLMVVNFAASFFMTTYHDFNGRDAKPPQGFNGFIGTCIGVGLTTLLAWGAGAFDLIF